jgi:hypothetical protein
MTTYRWSSKTISDNRRRSRTVHLTPDEARGIPVVGTNKAAKPNRSQRPRLRGSDDIRLGIRTPDGNTYMAAEYEGERRDRLQRERDEDNANKLALTAERLRRMREGVATQGALDLPDHW